MPEIVCDSRKYVSGDNIALDLILLACASGVAAIRAMMEEGVLENATRLGETMRAELGSMMERHPSIGDVCGLGMFNGIELVKNRETREFRSWLKAMRPRQ